MPSEDPDQLAIRAMVRVFTVRMMKPSVVGYPTERSAKTGHIESLRMTSTRRTCIHINIDKVYTMKGTAKSPRLSNGTGKRRRVVHI